MLRRPLSLILAPIALLVPVLTGCGNDDDGPSETTVAAVAETTLAASETTVAAATDTTAAAAAETTVAATDTTGAAADTTGAAAAETTLAGGAAGEPVALSPECAKDQLQLVKAGQLTIGTDKPAFAPWFSDDDPTNGKGFESAVAYAVADKLGFGKAEVNWATVPFNSSYAPGKKDFDFDINQISITEERKQAVDFSEGYYDVNQAVVVLNDAPVASATSIADLKQYKFGAQVGTTSLEFIKSTIAPEQEPFVYDDTNGAKTALTGKQIDAIVADLPTAFFISAAEIENSKVLGQFASQGGGEQFGLLFEKGNPLVGCVNQAIAALKSSGELAAIQERELAAATNAPVLQ